jgi:hypothetical protein
MSNMASEDRGGDVITLQSPTGPAPESSPRVAREAQRTWPFAACRPSSTRAHRRQDAPLRSAPAPRG